MIPVLACVGGAVAYALGAIPTGYVLGKAVAGVDVRTVGSGNVGATNVARTIGNWAGIAVLLMDIAKGVLAVTLLPWAVLQLTGAPLSDPWVLGYACLAVLGHDYSCYIGFTGGKGIATSGGVLLGMAPPIVGVLLGIWLIAFLCTRIVSVASMASAGALPFVCWILGYNQAWIFCGAALGVLALYKHNSNIYNILHGKEPRFSGKE